MKIRYLFLIFFLVSCGDSDFKKVELLDDFRILAIESNRPEANPGDNINLRLFVTDVGNSGGRIITGTMKNCTDPGISYGALVSCDHDPSTIETPITLDLTTPDFTNNDQIGFSDNIPVAIPVNYLQAKNNLEKFNGVPYLAIFEFNIDGKDLTYFKRIIITTRASLNSNPSSSVIYLNDSPMASRPVSGDTFQLDSDEPEIYSIFNVDGASESKKETYLVAWFLNQGELDFAKTDTNEKTEVSKLVSDDPLVIIAIVRDDRGGVEVVRQTFP